MNLTSGIFDCYDQQSSHHQFISSSLRRTKQKRMSQPSMTFAIIKPDAVCAGNLGNIIQRITDSGFKIRAMKLMHMSKPVAEGFYAVHRERPFFGELVEFMTSG